MTFETKISDLRYLYLIKKNIYFDLYLKDSDSERIVILFSKNDFPLLTTYIDKKTLQFHGFAYEGATLNEEIITTAKEVTEKIKNLLALEVFNYN